MSGRDSEVEVLKKAFMTKRSQNKRRFSPINYKQRWFILTKTELRYHDGDEEKVGKEKGQIELSTVRVVEPLIDSALDNRLHGFQVGYQEYHLYIVASTHGQREEWLGAIRELVTSNSCLADNYHNSSWTGSRWLCCGLLSRAARGCEPVTWVNKSDKIGNGTVSNTGTGSSPSGMPGGTNTPGTPVNRSRDGSGNSRSKLVVALYPFQAMEEGDLSLTKGDVYEVIDDTREHWWKVKTKYGDTGYIPSNYVVEHDVTGLHQYDWYVNDMSRQQAEAMLKHEDKEGCFLVRNSSTRGMYTLSLFTRVPHPQVKHYHIKQNSKGEYYLSERHCCPTIPELITYHRHNSGGLASRLKNPPSGNRSAPATAGLSHDKWEIDQSELTLMEELGSGQFGVVRHGKWQGSIDVAVKMMKEGSMSEDDFIEEAKVMTKLQHPNLVQLYGVCTKHRPIYIVTEYLRHGSLLNFLKRHEAALLRDIPTLFDFCVQVCKGMAYLERHNYIHRDLAARNCLVGNENLVKVADFGLARYVMDDQYTSSGGAKFPIKWAPPEVLNYTRFSSKSDVWAYGVLMWEVFTCGKMPYGRLKNAEVVERVQRGHLLEKPKDCPKDVYDIVMKSCWANRADDRPSFRQLKDNLFKLHALLFGMD